MNFRAVLSTVLLSVTLAACTTIEQKAPKIDKNSPHTAYQKAEISMKYDLVDEAIKYLNEALSIDPDHFPSCFLLGVAYLKKGSILKARSMFEKCVNLKPENSDSHLHLGSIYQTLGFKEDAEREYKEAYDIDQSFAASFNLAKLYFEKGELDSSLNYVRSALERNGNSGSAYNLQGVIFNQMKSYPEAILSFLNALKIDSKDYVAGVNLGAAYINNKEYDKARDLLNEILALVENPSLKEKIKEYLEAIKDIR